MAGLTGISLIAIFFMFLFRWGTTRKLSRWDVLPGAIAAAVVWQGLQQFGTVYVAAWSGMPTRPTGSSRSSWG